MSHSKNVDKQSNISDLSSDKEEPDVVSDDAEEKTDASNGSEDVDSGSDDCIWPTIRGSVKQEEIIEASRKRFREEIYKVMTKMSPSLLSLVKIPIKDESEIDVDKAEEEKKEESEDVSNVEPVNKQKKK